MPPYYVTTPIYYVNDRAHIGHCYTTLLADVLARFQRLSTGVPGEVFFLTGTDEHAEKVVTSAQAKGVSPIEHADFHAGEFAKAFEYFGFTNDDFIRTTQPRHITKVIEYIRALQQTGDVYLGDYVGWYDESQEQYLTDTEAKDANFVSPVTFKPLVKRTEKNYFLNLPKYQERLEAHIRSNPKFILPEGRRNEVLGRLRDGLQPVPISRAVTDDPTTQWGIRMPEDASHRIYVWIDALFNYLSAVDTDERRRFWPPRVHMMAKDILWFHAVIWPCLLMALGRELPGTIYAHSYWVREGRKMSKSLGNFVTIEVLQAYASRYSLDAVRWYMATQGPTGTNDADFSHAKFVEVYNADLANGLGNCASRVSNMIAKYFGGRVPEHRGVLTDPYCDWPKFTSEVVARAERAAGEPDLASVFECGPSIIRRVDGYINETRPFSLAKQIEAGGTDLESKRARLSAILYQCAEAVRIATVLMSPVMPTKTRTLLDQWHCAPSASVPLQELAAFGGKHGLRPGDALDKGDGLFMRADVEEAPPEEGVK